MKSIEPSFAGMFYEEEGKKLSASIDEFLSNTKKVVKIKPKAAIVPHAGYVYSGKVAAWGYKQIQEYNYKRIILIGPSHHESFDGLIRSSVDEFNTPLGSLQTNYTNLETLPINNEIFFGEHNIEVQLPFIKKIYGEVEIAPLLTGYKINIADVLPLLVSAVENDDTLLVVSSDLSHYLRYEECKIIDSKTINMIKGLNATIAHDQACGADGLNILLSIAKIKNWKPIFLNYANSGDSSGDESSVVGYTSFTFI